MQLYPGRHFHLFNRSNNNEVVFKERESFPYFLRKYQKYLGDLLDTVAYCLMPTHFHFLIHIRNFEGNGVELEQHMREVKDRIGILLSSYTKAINRRFHRHGSLFQHHTKAKEIVTDSLLPIVSYIHRNPVRARLVRRPEEWEFSSYRDYIGVRSDSFVWKEPLMAEVGTVQEFKRISAELGLVRDNLMDSI